jgi:hypothetical protein
VSEKVEPDAGNNEYLRRVEEELKKRN